MTLSLSNLAYNYKNNTGLKAWLEESYKVKGFGIVTENISTLFSQLQSNAGFNFYDGLDSYAPGLENTPMGDYENDGVKISTNPYYKQKDNQYYSYTSGTYVDGTGKIAINSAIAYTGVDALSGDNLLDPAGATTLAQQVNAFMATSAFTSLSGDPDKLVKLYKQLAIEMQGLKEYTLANSEITDAIAEINTLNGSGVIGNLETKIDSAEAELLNVFKAQLSSITARGTLPSVGLVFKGESNAANADGQEVYNAANDPNLRVKLFGNDYENNPFYKYYVALRTEKNLQFKDSVSSAIPEYNKSSSKIADGGTFKMGDYSGIQSGQEQLGPVDILDGLYGTQELKALFKQYEETTNKAKSMELSLTMAIQNSSEFDFRKALADKILAMLDTEHKLEVSNEASIVKNLKRGSSVGPSARQAGITSHKPFDGFYGDTNENAVPSTKDPNSLVDPYEIVINGTKYVMGRDSNSNGTIDNISEILGITDSAENPFQSLLLLDSDKDGAISKEELIANGIVLKAVDDSGKLTQNSFDMSMVNNIDLKKLNAVKDGNSVGTFEMTFLNGRTIQGSQTFENQAYFNTLFGKLVDLRPYQAVPAAKTTAVATTTATAATAATATTSTAATATTTEASTVASIARTTLLKQINSLYSGLIIDDTSNVETILDNSCWKTSTILTPAQRIRIIDSIDPMMPVYKIESEINAALQTLNN